MGKKTVDQHFGANSKYCFFAKFCCKFLAFLKLFIIKNAENDYFDQHLACAAGQNIKHTYHKFPYEIIIIYFVGQLLLHLMSGAALNSHDVHQYEASINGSWFYGATRNIGQAFNPTLAMINHSCDPNSVHYNIAKATISVATRNIAKGEEV